VPSLHLLVTGRKSNLHFQLTGLTGVICNFTTPLKDANVPIFAVSTWLALVAHIIHLCNAYPLIGIPIMF
jgi:hypothetical protein